MIFTEMKVVITRRRIFLFIVSVLAIAVITFIGFALSSYVLNDSKQEIQPSTTNRDDIFQRQSGSENGMRAYIADLSSKSEYEIAKSASLELLRKTQSPEDAIAVASLCHAREVSNKDSCLSEAANVLNQRASSLDFYTLYGGAEIYDKQGDTVVAKRLFTFALEKYPSQINPELPLKSKTELESYIKSL